MLSIHSRRRVWARTAFAGAAVLGLGVSSAFAESGDGLCPPVKRTRPPAVICVPCPPPQVTPAPPEKVTPPTEPIIPPTMPEAPAPTLEPGLAAGVGGDTLAVNMFGDIFGGRSSVVVIPRPPIVIPGTPPFTRTESYIIKTPGGNGNGGGFPAVFVATDGTTTMTTSDSPLLINGVPIVIPGNTITSAQVLTAAPLGTRYLILETPNITSVVAANFAQPGETTQFNPNSAAILIDIANPLFLNVEEIYNFITPGTPDRIIPQPPIIVLLPNPSGGGVVGRTKIADDNNPLPRDRFILNFDYFDNVPLTATGVDVRRWSPGFEKTFFDRRTSIEVRFPFASTLDSDVTANGLTNTHTEFGNIHVTLKALLLRSDVLNVAAGLGIDLPTADDTSVRLGNGTDLVRISNDAVLLTPYVGALFTPGPRFFLQGWYQIGIDANGNPVSVNPNLNGLVGVGKLTDPTLMMFDLQLGYWLIRSSESSGLLRALAPFIEFHYNTTVTDPDVIQAGNFIIGDLNGRVDELNLSAGIITQVGDNLNLSAGIAVPLKRESDRFFDYQIGIRASYFFGPTARAREQAAQVSGF
jgi:hypothetical protein